MAVRAGFLERVLVRSVSCEKLHPNPEDEFCKPEVGPNHEIISRYEKDFRRLRYDPEASRFMKSGAYEPLDVQKISPDGYMILNGHHRWIAVLRAGISQMPVRVVNLMSEKDVRKALENSAHTLRLTLDLDEVVFAPDGNGNTEKPLPFPMNRFYRERLRLGIPALFELCAAEGFDIWLYSSGYQSVDYVRELLKGYHTRVTGIIAGTERSGLKEASAGEIIETLKNAGYARTVHAGNGAVQITDRQKREVLEYPLNGGEWAAQVMEIIREMKRNG